MYFSFTVWMGTADAAADADAESLPFFDESRAPVHTMQVLSQIN
jgi:hypothetical protein